MIKFFLKLIIIVVVVALIYLGVQIFFVKDSKIASYYKIIKNGKTMVPIGDVVKVIGGTTKWDPATKKITTTYKTTKIELWVGKNIALINGTETKIDPSNDEIVPQIIGGKTCLPLNFVINSLGKSVAWDAILELIRKKVVTLT